MVLLFLSFLRHCIAGGVTLWDPIGRNTSKHDTHALHLLLLSFTLLQYYSFFYDAEAGREEGKTSSHVIRTGMEWNGIGMAFGAPGGRCISIVVLSNAYCTDHHYHQQQQRRRWGVFESVGVPLSERSSRGGPDLPRDIWSHLKFSSAAILVARRLPRISVGNEPPGCTADEGPVRHHGTRSFALDCGLRRGGHTRLGRLVGGFIEGRIS